MAPAAGIKERLKKAAKKVLYDILGPSLKDC